MRSPNVPADADLEKIEKYLKQKYKLALKAVENRHTYLLQPETYEELDIYYNLTADLILIEHHFLNQYYQSETIIKALNSRAKSDRDTYHQERQDLVIKLVDKMPNGNVTIETRYTVVEGDMSEKPDNSTYNLKGPKCCKWMQIGDADAIACGYRIPAKNIQARKSLG